MIIRRNNTKQYKNKVTELDIEKKLNGFKELYEKSLNYYSYELSKLGLYSVRKKDGQLSYDYRKYFLKNTTRLDENLISLSIFFKKENERISNISHDNDEIFNDKLLNYKDTYRLPPNVILQIKTAPMLSHRGGGLLRYDFFTENQVPLMSVPIAVKIALKRPPMFLSWNRSFAR